MTERLRLDVQIKLGPDFTSSPPCHLSSTPGHPFPLPQDGFLEMLSQMWDSLPSSQRCWQSVGDGPFPVQKSVLHSFWKLSGASLGMFSGCHASSEHLLWEEGRAGHRGRKRGNVRWYCPSPQESVPLAVPRSLDLPTLVWHLFLQPFPTLAPCQPLGRC